LWREGSKRVVRGPDVVGLSPTDLLLPGLLLLCGTQLEAPLQPFLLLNHLLAPLLLELLASSSTQQKERGG
jgi:hypothetical protein